MLDKSKLLHRPFPKGTWWTLRKTYTLFMIREFTAFAIGGFAILAVLIVQSVKHGTFHELLTFLQQPYMIVISGLALALAMYHSITWFLLAGRLLYIPQGDGRVPPKIIAGGHFAAWIVVSIFWWALFYMAAWPGTGGGH